MEERPLITFALFAYNQERFIREAVDGAFSQTYSPLEIILSDDCSSDCTFEIMKEMAAEYQGPHQIILNRNEKNLGIGGHVNRVMMELAKGELIVVAAGDDISKNDRTEKIVHCYLNLDRRPRVIHSEVNWIDKRGNLLNHRKDFPEDREYHIVEAVNNGYGTGTGCTCAYHHDIYHLFGKMEFDILNEDFVLPLRGGVLGTYAHISEELVSYRSHRNSISMRRDIRCSFSDKLLLNSKFKANFVSCICELDKILSRDLSPPVAAVINGLKQDKIDQLRYTNELLKRRRPPLLFVLKNPTVKYLRRFCHDLFDIVMDSVEQKIKI
jgi:glycosyltransferase involved in cell wall biosynthesis